MKNDQRKAISKLKIEKAAARLFSQRNYDIISMDEIAREAEVSKRTVYKYFPSKISLLSAVFEHYLQEEYVALVKAFETCHTARERLAESIRVTYEFSRDNLQFMKFLWSINDEQWGKKVPVDIVERVNGWNKMLFDKCVDAIKDIRYKPGVPAFAPETLVHYTSAVNKGFLIQATKETSKALKTISPEDLVQMELAMFLSYIEPDE